MAEQPTPEERAAAAAEALDAAGEAVTARAVRERAGVSMSVALAAAGAWKAEQAQRESIPEIPDAVQARMRALWGEAVHQARSEHAATRAGLQAEVDAVTDERDALTDEVTRLETEAARVRRELQTSQSAAAAAQQRAADAAAHTSRELADARSRADRAEAKAEAISDERDRLLREVDTLRAALDKATTDQAKPAR